MWGGLGDHSRTKGGLVCREQEKNQGDLQRGAQELVLQADNRQESMRQRRETDRCQERPGSRERHTERKEDRQEQRQTETERQSHEGQQKGQ